jgi:hypothetical protein
LKLKCAHSPLNLRILSSTSVPFALLQFSTKSHETDYSVPFFLAYQNFE